MLSHVLSWRCLGSLSLLCPRPPPSRFTSLWRVIDLPCETHATVLLSSPPHPLSSLSFLFPPTLPPPRPSLLIPPSLLPTPSTPQPHTENDQPSLVWFDRGKFYLTFEGKFTLHQGSVYTQLFRGSSVQASPPQPSPAPSFLPFSFSSSSFCSPSITLTTAMLTPGWAPSCCDNSVVLSDSTFSSWHDSFWCRQHSLPFIPWRMIVLRVHY